MRSEVNQSMLPGSLGKTLKQGRLGWYLVVGFSLGSVMYELPSGHSPEEIGHYSEPCRKKMASR